MPQTAHTRRSLAGMIGGCDLEPRLASRMAPIVAKLLLLQACWIAELHAKLRAKYQ